MIFLTFLFLLTSNIFAFESATGYQGSKIIGTLDNLLEGLASEKWDPEETACRHATEAVLNGVKNNTMWATWVWDSMQLPVGTFYGTLYHLGNFDQCLTVPWPKQGVKTQYCLVDVRMANVMNQYDEQMLDPYDDVEKYVGAKFKFGKRLDTLYFGVCLPASCNPESIAKISRRIFRMSHLPLKDVTVHPRDCQVAESVIEKPKQFYIFWFIILMMVVACIFISLFDDSLKKPHSTVSKIANCFCLTRNLHSLTEQYKDEIKVMNGIRFITCAAIIVIHFAFMSKFALVNLMDLEKTLLNGYFWELPLHVDLCVVTFCSMSGLLHLRGLMSSTSFQPFRTVFKRYIRLLFPLYALSITSMIYVQPYFGSGPIWPRMVRKHFEPCAKSWWKNLLMITNRVEEEGVCSVTSWFLHCDFQLTIFGTAIFIVYRKNKRTGFIFGSFAFVLSVIVSVIWSYWQELPGLLWYDFGESMDFGRNRIYATVYVPFYIRASTYLMGAALGYVMAVYKPQNCKNIFSKRTSFIGFIIGVSLIVFNLAIGAKMFRNEYGPIWMAMLGTLDKTIWAAGFALIIIVCEYGTITKVNNFLGSAIFVPLSKLCYSAYLCHTIFIAKDVYSLRTLTRFDMPTIITIGLGYVVMTFAMCFLIWMFIEAPVTNLINLIFEFNRSPSRPKNKTKPEETEEAIYSNNDEGLVTTKKRTCTNFRGISTNCDIVKIPTDYHFEQQVKMKKICIEQ